MLVFLRDFLLNLELPLPLEDREGSQLIFKMILFHPKSSEMFGK